MERIYSGTVEGNGMNFEELDDLISASGMP